jgi:hypothetical protein
MIALAGSIYFAVRLGRLLPPLEQSETLSQTLSAYAARPRYIGAVRYVVVLQGILLIGLLVQSVYLHRKISCYVTPRRLTSGQITTIADYLKKEDRKPYEIILRFPTHDDEAGRYVEDF